MTDAPDHPASESVVQGTVDPAAEAYYSGAVNRILRVTAVLSIPGAIAVFALYGFRACLGFSVGAALGYLNFRWLSSSVEGLATRIAAANLPEDAKLGGLKASSAFGLIVRFIGRILLVALAAYVIFRGSRIGLFGFMAGLGVPVAAMLFEAVHEVTTAFRRGL